MTPFITNVPVWRLSTKSIEGVSTALERVDDIHRRDGLTPGVISVRHGVTNNLLEKELEYPTGFLVCETGDALDTSAASQTADGGFGDSLDIIAQNLPVTFGTTLSDSLASQSTTLSVLHVRQIMNVKGNL